MPEHWRQSVVRTAWMVSLLWVWGCGNPMSTQRPYVLQAWFENPAYLGLSPESVVMIQFQGRRFRGLQVAPVVDISSPLYLEERSELVFGIGGPVVENGELTVLVTLEAPLQGTGPMELMNETVPTRGPFDPWRRIFRLSLRDWQKQWVEIRIRVEALGVPETAKFWLLEPVIIGDHAPEIPWAPVGNPDKLQRQFRVLNNRYHVVLAVIDGLAYGDLYLDVLGKTAWRHVAEIAADAIGFVRVHPVFSDPDANFRAQWYGTTDFDTAGPGLPEVFIRALKRVRVLVPADGGVASLLQDTRGLERVATVGDLVRRARSWIRLTQAQGRKAAAVMAFRPQPLGTPDRSLDNALGDLYKALAEGGLDDRTVFCILGTGRASAAELQPGFLLCHFPAGVFVPTAKVRAPISGLDVLPTLRDAWGSSRKGWPLAGRSRFAWWFMQEHPRDRIVWTWMPDGGWGSTSDWYARIQDGSVLEVRPWGPEAEGFGRAVFEAFMKDFFLAHWKTHMGDRQHPQMAKRSVGGGSV